MVRLCVVNDDYDMEIYDVLGYEARLIKRERGGEDVRSDVN